MLLKIAHFDITSGTRRASFLHERFLEKVKEIGCRIFNLFGSAGFSGMQFACEAVRKYFENDPIRRHDGYILEIAWNGVMGWRC